MPDIEKIANRADVIVNGYAFENGENEVRVLNLNKPDKAAVFNNENEVIETTMDDIELSIVKKLLINSRKYMEN